MKLKFLDISLFAVLALLIAIIQLTAVKYGLYWHLWWIDNVTHFLSGFFVAWGALLLKFSIVGRRRPIRSDFIFMFVVVFVVGIGWEIFEYIEKLVSPIGYTLDTSLDLLMDFLGATFAFKYLTVFLRMDPRLNSERLVK